MLRDLKLIAEPWDVGTGRLSPRRVSRRHGASGTIAIATRCAGTGAAMPGRVGELATRLAGSSDIFAARSRPPSRSINFVAAHDGFTLADLVTYATKHNEANGEDNRDGSNANDSWNHGVEGPTDDPGIVAARQRDVRNLLATLFVSRGTPMLAMGDELGRTQRGNNNGYAQDNALTWLDWSAADDALVAFVARLIDLRKRHAALHEDRWLEGSPAEPADCPTSNGGVRTAGSMDGADWTNPEVRSLVVVLRPRDADADRANGVAIAFNAGNDPLAVHWPEPRDGYAWRSRIDTALPTGLPDDSGSDARGQPRRSRPGRSSSSAKNRKRRRGAEARRRARGARSSSPRPRASPRIGGMSPDSGTSSAPTRNARCSQRWAFPPIRHPTRARISPPSREPRRQSQERRERRAAPSRRHGSSVRAMFPAARASRRRTTLRARRASVCAPARRRSGHRRFHDTRRNRRGHRSRRRQRRRHQSAARALPARIGERASPYHPSDRRFLDPIYIDVERVPDLAASDEARALLAQSGGAIARARRERPRRLRRRLGVEGARCCTRALPRSTSARQAIRCGGIRALRRRRRRAAAAVRALRGDRGGASARAVAGMARTRCASPTRRATRDFARAACASRSASRFTCNGLRTANSTPRPRRAGERPRVRDSSAISPSAPRPTAPRCGRIRPASRAACRSARRPIRFPQDGQNWNLPPPNPEALRRIGLRRVRRVARRQHAACRRAADRSRDGAHAALLDSGRCRCRSTARMSGIRWRLLLRVLATESVRARCLVVGEDLGTVPEGLRERLAAADVLSYRVLWFEREGSSFVAPARYPPKAAAACRRTTCPRSQDGGAAPTSPRRPRSGLLDARRRGGREDRARARRSARSATRSTRRACRGRRDAVSRHSARRHDHGGHSPVTPGAAASALVLLQADDLAGETAALNLPGTDRERPNWRRKVRVGVDALWSTPAARSAIADFAPTRTGR